MNMLNTKFSRNITYLILPVMMLFTLNSAFASCFGATQSDLTYTTTNQNRQQTTSNQQVTSIQWYISNGKDVVGTTNDAGEGKQADSYDYTPYGRGTTLSSQAGGRWSVAGRSGQQTVDCRLNTLDRHLTPRELQSNSSKIKPCRSEATSVGGHLTQLRQGYEGQVFNIKNNPFQYSGYYLDVLSGLYYLNARYYSPEFMRFISRDSYDLSNRYAYCNGEPVSQVDPGGHMAAWLNTSLSLIVPGYGLVKGLVDKNGTEALEGGINLFLCIAIPGGITIGKSLAGAAEEGGAAAVGESALSPQRVAAELTRRLAGDAEYQNLVAKQSGLRRIIGDLREAIQHQEADIDSYDRMSLEDAIPESERTTEKTSLFGLRKRKVVISYEQAAFRKADRLSGMRYQKTIVEGQCRSYAKELNQINHNVEAREAAILEEITGPRARAFSGNVFRVVRHPNRWR